MQRKRGLLKDVPRVNDEISLAVRRFKNFERTKKESKKAILYYDNGKCFSEIVNVFSLGTRLHLKSLKITHQLWHDKKIDDLDSICKLWLDLK